jgi:ABC-type sugar transport system permease subunit
MTVVSTPVRVPSGTARGRRRVRRLTGRDRAVVATMVGLPLILVLGLVWLPTLASVGLSFTDWNGIGGLSTARSVGGQNYHHIVSTYPPFWPAVRHNLLWLAVFGFVATPAGLLMAYLLDKNIRFSRVYQSALFLPVVLSLALVGFIWQLVYSPDQGLLNPLLGKSAPADRIDWYGDPHINIWAVLVAASWRHVGYVMVLYLAGLKSVDPALREAAALDGASEWQAFRSVVFPALKPINVTIAVITVIEALRAFDIVYIVNRGTNGLELLSALITNNIIGEASRIGFGSALAVILLLISLVPIVTFLVQTFRKERRE